MELDHYDLCRNYSMKPFLLTEVKTNLHMAIQNCTTVLDVFGGRNQLEWGNFQVSEKLIYINAS